MGTWDWQLALALMCVAWAMVALVRRMGRWWFGKAVLGCGTSACDGCAGQPRLNSRAAERQLVSIHMPGQNDRRTAGVSRLVGSSAALPRPSD